MRNLNANFIQEKNKKENDPIFLYTLFDYDGGGSNLYFAEYPEDVTFDGITYTAFPLQFETVGENTSFETDEVRLTLANVSRLIQGYLETYEIRGKKVEIKKIFKETIAVDDAFITWTFWIDRIDADHRNVTLYLSSKFDVRDLKIPQRTILRTHCKFKFKGSQCGYVGAETECNRTLQRCRELDNNLRYGGFPSAGGDRIYV